MKKIFTAIIVLTMVLATSQLPSFAAKKKGGAKGLSKEALEKVVTDVNSLTKKVYSSSLFTPKDNENLIDIKLQLDTAILAGAAPEYAQLYYKAGNLYKIREYDDEAIECYQTVLENYSDTPFAAKATKELKKMGVEILDSEEEEE